MRNQLIAEAYTRKLLKTEDPVEKVLEDEYLNEFKFQVRVGDVITVINGGRKTDIYISQIEPFVKSEYYRDYDRRLDALEEAVAELKRA